MLEGRSVKRPAHVEGRVTWQTLYDFCTQRHEIISETFWTLRYQSLMHVPPQHTHAHTYIFKSQIQAPLHWELKALSHLRFITPMFQMSSLASYYYLAAPAPVGLFMSAVWRQTNLTVPQWGQTHQKRDCNLIRGETGTMEHEAKRQGREDAYKLSPWNRSRVGSVYCVIRLGAARQRVWKLWKSLCAPRTAAPWRLFAVLKFDHLWQREREKQSRTPSALHFKQSPVAFLLVPG